MAKKRFIKSADELDEDQNQFELDESVIDEVSNAEEFADVEITNEDIMDAVEAIGALADAVIEKANIEEKEIDADEILDEVRDLIDEPPAEDDNEEISEDEELPEELVNSAVRVMVSEDGAVELESTPDEVYNDTLDGMECTVFDTCDDIPLDVEETADEPEEDEMLVIGNSKAKNFKKGFVVLKSSANKKAWSAAVKKVKKMIGSKKKMTAAHWAIVSAIAKKEEEDEKLKKKIECKLIKIIRSNKELKAKLIKSSEEFDSEGQPVSEMKPEDTAGVGNPGFEEDKPAENQESPEEITSESGNPTEDPDKQNENEGDIVLPEEEVVVLEVPLTNSKKKIRLQKVASSKLKKFNTYKVLKSTKELETLDGKCIKCGKIAYVFKNSSVGLITCAARFADSGKGTYKPVLKNNVIVIGRGKEAPVFQNCEKVLIARKIASAREVGRLMAKKEALLNARRPVRRPEAVKSARRPVEPRRAPAKPNPIKSARRPVESRKPVMNASERRMKVEAIKSNIAEKNAIRQQANLKKMYDQEERQRLFQNSLKEMNEEKTIIKNNNTRNSTVLDKLYKGMFS